MTSSIILCIGYYFHKFGKNYWHQILKTQSYGFHEADCEAAAATLLVSFEETNGMWHMATLGNFKSTCEQSSSSWITFHFSHFHSQVLDVDPSFGTTSNSCERWREIQFLRVIEGAKISQGFQRLMWILYETHQRYLISLPFERFEPASKYH